MPPSHIAPQHFPSSSSTQPPNSSSPSPSPPDDDHDHQATLPLPLSQSIILTSLPKDATLALAKAEEGNDGVPAKVTIRFQPIASAPRLRQLVFKISSSNRFETVVSFLKKKLDRERGGAGGAGAAGSKEGAFPFCYVNSVFAPGLDEGVGGLWRCFKTDDQLIVAYSMTPAFG